MREKKKRNRWREKGGEGRWVYEKDGDLSNRQQPSLHQHRSPSPPSKTRARLLLSLLAMAPRPLSLLVVVLLASLLHLARSDVTSSELLQGLNSYRASLKLPALTQNDNAECLAEQLAEQFKGQPCSNTTGSSTVPGTEQQFPNFPDFLNHCHLNATVTQDGVIMPACVPNLDKNILLSNFTKTQYNENLNSSSFVGAGIADEGDWVVVVLTKNTPTGSFVSVTGYSPALKVGFHYHLLPLLMAAILVLMN